MTVASTGTLERRSGDWQMDKGPSITMPNGRLYLRNWITRGGNHAVELREEWGGKDNSYSIRRHRWYYKNVGSALDKIEALLRHGIPIRIGWTDLDRISAAASARTVGGEYQN